MFNYKNMQNNKTKYINHTLNNSPSKTAYSFGQSVRFPTYTPYQGVILYLYIVRLIVYGTQKIVIAKKAKQQQIEIESIKEV